MAPAVVRAVAQAKASQASNVHASSVKTSILKALPKQAGKAAAVLLANAGAASMAFADSLDLPEVTLPVVDASAASDVASLFSDNPVLIGGGAALIAIPLGVTALLRSNSPAGVKPTSVARTIQALEEDPRVVLVDVRSRAEIKQQGSPDLRSVKRSATVLPYTNLVKGESVIDEGFADKFGRLKGISEESLVILLDSDGTIAKMAAADLEELVEKVYYVQGGAEAWEEQGPWRSPSKGLSLPSLDLKSVGSNINELAEDFKKAPSLTKASLAVGAIAGAGFLAFNEIEVVLELAGLFAAGNFLLKLVFADEREKTLSEIKTLVDDKVAIQEVGSDLNKIAKAVLEEVPADSKPAAPKPAVTEAAAPSPAAASSEETPQNVKEAREWVENWKSNTTA
jgi:chitinase domain-containing protein 1